MLDILLEDTPIEFQKEFAQAEFLVTLAERMFSEVSSSYYNNYHIWASWNPGEIFIELVHVKHEQLNKRYSVPDFIDFLLKEYKDELRQKVIDVIKDELGG